MARFSVGGEEDDEGPRFKKHRADTSEHQLPQPQPNDDEEEDDADLLFQVEEVGVEEYILSEQQNEDEEEEEEDDDDIDEEEEEEVEEGCNEDQRSKSVERTSNGGDAVGPNGDGSISVTLTDPDVLDCPICLETLTVPVFQCENGHVVCSSCCSKLRYKCATCLLPIGYNRCRAIEKVLESVKISCRNLKYGCTETVSYSKKHEHEQMCIHVPCSCPLPDCDFVGSSKHLYMHFSSKHPNSATRFRNNSLFSIAMGTSQTYLILQEDVEGIIFVLNLGVESIAYAANINSIGPSSSKTEFSYDLIVKNGNSSVKIQSVTESVPRWVDHFPQKAFLLVPRDFVGSSGRLRFHICIRRRRLLPSC